MTEIRCNKCKKIFTGKTEKQLQYNIEAHKLYCLTIRRSARELRASIPKGPSGVSPNPTEVDNEGSN